LFLHFHASDYARSLHFGKHEQQWLAMPPLLGTTAQHHLFPNARLATTPGKYRSNRLTSQHVSAKEKAFPALGRPFLSGSSEKL
jgi:hypothetical protein